jgi:hypothetical protein
MTRMGWLTSPTKPCPECGAIQQRATFSPPIGKVVRTCINGHTWRTPPKTHEKT